MDQIKIIQFVKDQRFDGFLMVKSAEKRTNKNGDPYMDITLSDNSLDINAKVWNCDDLPPLAGTVIKVRGSIVEYNSRLQMKIERMREACKEDGVDVAQLVSSAPKPADQMFQEITSIIETMQNPVLKAITFELIRRAEEKIQYYPAAQSMHHAERSGLLHHLTDMLAAARAICAWYPQLDQDLVTAGVIVHDLGKLTEMVANTMGNVSEYSKEGLLLGHIITGVADLRDVAKGLGYTGDEEYVLLLSHMVLSHHGIPEYGSPKPPMFPEAEVLNWLDVLDSRLNEMQTALDRTKPGCFSDRIFALDRRVYHPHYQNEITNEAEGPLPFDDDESVQPEADNMREPRRTLDSRKEYERLL